MASTTVRLGSETRELLRRLSATTGDPMSTIIERAVECYRRQYMLEETNTAFAAMRSDLKAWAQEAAEREDWDATLSDGLDDGDQKP